MPLIDALTQHEKAEVQLFMKCKDINFKEKHEKLMFFLMHRYGIGYDRLKTIQNIVSGLAADLEMLDGE